MLTTGLFVSVICSLSFQQAFAAVCFPGISTDPIKLAAFNIKTFGISKMGKAHIATRIAEIVRRYDIIMIQEVRDSSFEALHSLIDLVNADSEIPYAFIVSERVGRTSYKEQYAAFYRPSVVTPLMSRQYDDGVDDGTDVFEREPFIVRFHVRNPEAALSELAIVGIHTKPTDTKNEMNHLVDVYDDIEDMWNLPDVLIMGDLNADCSYASKTALSGLAIRTDPRFTWFIEDTDDTTTSASDCAYDRFISAGNKLYQAIVPGSAKVFRFDTAYNMTQAEAYDVSDHYPIEIELR